MADGIYGIHHITAIAGDAQKNVDFFTEVLGLRFIKKTINFDDPHTYHFYFGDYQGNPGTILTFFPWSELAPRGVKGTGQIIAISFSVPLSSLNWWFDRLSNLKIDCTGPFKRFGDEVILFYDSDGLELELIGSNLEKRKGWSYSEIPEEHSIRGFYSALLFEENKEQTEKLLLEHMHFRKINEEKNRTRYECGSGGPGTYIDILELPNEPRGRIGVGIIHHIAYRVRDDQSQLRLRSFLMGHGYAVTDVRDRNYFHSIYFYEPGGVLFEGATDPPGFTVDEPLEELGTHLMLPEWYEQYREEIEETLPIITVKEKQKH